jgi:hypothetical protein
MYFLHLNQCIRQFGISMAQPWLGTSKIGIKDFVSTSHPFGPNTSENLANSLLQSLIFVEIGENYKIIMKSPNF